MYQFIIGPIPSTDRRIIQGSPLLTPSKISSIRNELLSWRPAVRNVRITFMFLCWHPATGKKMLGSQVVMKLEGLYRVNRAKRLSEVPLRQDIARYYSSFLFFLFIISFFLLVYSFFYLWTLLHKLYLSLFFLLKGFFLLINEWKMATFKSQMSLIIILNFIIILACERIDNFLMRFLAENLSRLFYSFKKL